MQTLVLPPFSTTTQLLIFLTGMVGLVSASHAHIRSASSHVLLHNPSSSNPYCSTTS